MRRLLAIAVASAVSFGFVPRAASEPPRPIVVVPGELTTIPVTLVATNRPAGVLTYEIDATRGVEVLGRRTGSLTWDPALEKSLETQIRVIVSSTQPPGRFVAARIALTWPDGQRESIDVWADVQSTAAPTVSSAKQLDAEVVAVPEAAPPGGTIKLRFAVYSNEETDERVHVRIVAAPGWTLLGSEDPQREWLVEAYDEVEGEVRLSVPEDASIGSRQLVRLLVEVVGEPGVIEAQSYVSVVKRGRGNPNAPVVSGTSIIGVSRVGPGGFQEARSTGGLQLSTTFGRHSSLSFSFERGLRDTLSNYRYTEEPTQIVGDVRHAGWDISFGNRIPSMGNVLTGPFVQGVGGSLRRSAGRLLAELVVAQPAEFADAAAGHLVRGQAGLRANRGSIAFVFSDFGRPAGGYTTLPAVQPIPLDPDEEEQIEIERAWTERAPSNRVLGAGTEIELRSAGRHRFTARAGGLRLSNELGDVLSAPAGEASYALSFPKTATLNVRWREMPPTLAGIYVSGDDRTVDGSLRVRGPLRVVGRAFQNNSETMGRAFQSRAEGGSFGMRYLLSGRRLEARWNYRESEFTRRTIKRTLSVTGGTPLGPVRLSASTEIGAQDNGRTVSRLAYYRGDLRWTSKTGTFSFGVSRIESSGVARERADVIASLNARRWELAGGGWFTRGYTSGGHPGMWASVGVPVGHGQLITLGVDRASITWTAEPAWRATLAIRQRFSLALPFVGRPESVAPAGIQTELLEDRLTRIVSEP